MSSSTSSDIVVRTRKLGKAYQLYARRNDWLKQVMFGWWKSFFKPFWVLRDIDLEVHRGESIGILGRSRRCRLRQCGLPRRLARIQPLDASVHFFARNPILG